MREPTIINTNEFGQPIGASVGDWTPPPRPPRTPMPGRYCTVDPLTEQHADELHAAQALDVVGRNWTYLSYGPFPTLDEYRRWIIKMCSGDDPRFHAILDSDGRAVGVAAYLRIDPNSGSIEVGYINFSPALQRSRAATEAMFLMMQRAFELGYRRYEWKCDALNAPSRAAAQRFGLSFEGVWRQATVYKGRNRDTAWYAATDKDWPALAAAFTAWLAPNNFDESGRQRVALRDLTRPLLVREG